MADTRQQAVATADAYQQGNIASNWNKGLSLDAYKQSLELQDKAFKLNAEQDHRRGLEQGFLGDDEKPGRVAGFLKAAHIVGFNSAREAMTGGRAYRDANGVSNYDRIHDISRNGDGLDKRMTAVRLDPSETPVGKTVTPSASVAQADHPEHGRYREMYAMLGAVSGLASDQERQQAAASMMVAIKASKKMHCVDHIVPRSDGVVFAVQGDLRDLSHKILSLDLAGLASQPVEKSTAQLGALAPQPDPLAEAQRQERTRLV